MKRHLKPCGDRVLVRLKPFNDVSEGGIILAVQTKDAERYAMQEAYVVELGYDAFKGLGSGEPWCKVGDLVLIAKYSGEDRGDIEDGEIYRLISDENVYGVFTGEGLDD